MQDTFNRNLSEHIGLFSQLESLTPVVNEAAQIVVECLSAGGVVYLCGNGGSAADSQHIAAELTGRFLRERAPLAGIALTTDTSALTAIGNDYGFNEVFARQLEGLARKNDCLIAISTSGNSRNVVRAAETAKTLGVKTIGLLGGAGGVLKDLCDVSVVVPSKVTARIQEAHILIGHSLCEVVDNSLIKSAEV
jgi:D-sedoheptulose 7-phosphate isomerase